MLPLIASGIATVANNAIEMWAHAPERRAAEKAQTQVAFDSLLQKATGQASAAEKNRTLRDVIESPEVELALGGRDLSESVAIRVQPGGGLAIVGKDGVPHPVKLSAETAALVKKLCASWATSNETAALSTDKSFELRLDSSSILR